MKKALLAFAVLLSSSVAFADQQPAWQTELAQFQQDIKDYSTVGVWGEYVYNTSASIVTCTTDIAFTAAVFVAQTAPVVNGAVQIIASYPNFGQDLAGLLTWNGWASATRGVAGGGVVAVTDSLQFIVLWLDGNQSQSYQSLAATYATTAATANALFADQGECMMKVAKAVIASNELQARDNASQQTPVSKP